MDKDIKDGIIESFAGNLIRLGNECRDHALEVKRLKAELANLKTEADRLKDENQLVREESDRHYQLWVDSQAEVERLRKAGDDLWEFAKVSDTLARKELRKVLKAWHKAKEGKQS